MQSCFGRMRGEGWTVKLQLPSLRAVYEKLKLAWGKIEGAQHDN
jgi:hypothetical protein